MSEQTPRSAPGARSLPDNPNLDWLRKQAKRQLEELRKTDPAAQLADAQFELAKSYGFSSWRALKAHIESLTIEGQLFDTARKGDVEILTTLLDAHPDKLLARDKPYEWTLLHAAAQNGRLAVVDLLLARGLDVNAREKGDDTYAMHWAAAAGHLDVVRRLADAGGDVVGRGDDHELDVIGWATCWDGCDDAAHRAVADFLVSRGAQHHIFSAIALNLADEVRRLVAANSAALNSRMSRNENSQTPLHFAARMNRPQMISVLLELGADPLAVDGAGQPVAAYATAQAVDRPVMDAIRAMTMAELTSAERGHRPSRGAPMDLVASLALADWETAARLVHDDTELLKSGGALHLLAKRDDLRAVKWLLDHGVDPNARWGYGDAEATALHMAVWGGSADVVRLLLDAGADPRIHDSQHDDDAIGWAEHFGRSEIRQILKTHATKS
ncbi:MAG: ankyrin repeat domain-containing protein [Gemmatimonadetes bacterium]|nr:ankyrin repeat domain-containing protein [Gemmatimonadota bacterium]